MLFNTALSTQSFFIIMPNEIVKYR